MVLFVSCLIIDFALIHLQLFDASIYSSITIDAMHPFNKENLAPSSNMQLKSSKSTTITCLQKGGNTIFDKLVIPFVHVEQDLNFWNYVEGSFALRDIISKYQKTLFVVTHIINFPKDYVAV